VALALGLALGWYRQRQPATPNADVAQARLMRQTREEVLLQHFSLTYDPAAPPIGNNVAGLKNAAELGMLYLEEHRLEEADRFFQKLCTNKEKWCAGRLLSQLGDAMVLAFRNEPRASNRRFLELYHEFNELEQASRGGAKLRPDDVAVYNLLWKTTPPAAGLRELVARALYFNAENDPGRFPDQLRAWRIPPGIKGG
jgi:hypothetical protein